MGSEMCIRDRLKTIFPNFEEIVVNVAEMIRAPPRDQRIRAWFPDPQITNQVKFSRGFSRAVKRCEAMLRNKGIVVVACKGGHHRAPTVASHLRCDYVVHCVIHYLSIDHIAGIIYTCYRRSPESRGSGMNWLDLDRCAHVGWDWYGFQNDDKWADDYAAPYLERGDVVIVEEVYALDYVSVTRRHDGFKVEMAFAWLLPLVVLEAPPLAPPLAPSSASADEALVPLSPRAPRNGRPREARA